MSFIFSSTTVSAAVWVSPSRSLFKLEYDQSTISPFALTATGAKDCFGRGFLDREVTEYVRRASNRMEIKVSHTQTFFQSKASVVLLLVVSQFNLPFVSRTLQRTRTLMVTEVADAKSRKTSFWMISGSPSCKTKFSTFFAFTTMMLPPFLVSFFFIFPFTLFISSNFACSRSSWWRHSGRCFGCPPNLRRKLAGDPFSSGFPGNVSPKI